VSEQNILELGHRAATFLRAENYGLTRQRVDAIAKHPRWRRDWIIIREGDIPVRMEWQWVYR
jgi:hypothetical protein